MGKPEDPFSEMQRYFSNLVSLNAWLGRLRPSAAPHTEELSGNRYRASLVVAAKGSIRGVPICGLTIRAQSLKAVAEPPVRLRGQVLALLFTCTHVPGSPQKYYVAVRTPGSNVLEGHFSHMAGCYTNGTLRIGMEWVDARRRDLRFVRFEQ